MSLSFCSDYLVLTVLKGIRRCDILVRLLLLGTAIIIIIILITTLLSIELLKIILQDDIRGLLIFLLSSFRRLLFRTM